MPRYLSAGQSRDVSLSPLFLLPRASSFLSPRGVSRGISPLVFPKHFFLVTPNEVRGRPFSLFPATGRFLASLEKTGWGVDAVPNEVRKDAVPSKARDASLALGRTKQGCHPRTPHFLVTPNASEGSLGACAPREAMVGGCHPERKRGVSFFMLQTVFLGL